MPKINNGAYVISNEMLLDKSRYVDLLFFILELIDKGYTDVFFLLEPIVSRASLYEDNKSFYAVLGYSSIITYNEYLLKHVVGNLGIRPYIVVEPFWARTLTPLRRPLYVYTDIDYIKGLFKNKHLSIISIESSIDSPENISKPCLCIGNLCKDLITYYGVIEDEFTAKHVCGKLSCRDKTNFIVYDVCDESRDICINVYAVDVSLLDELPLKSLLTIGSSSVVIEHVVEPIIMIPLQNYPSNLKNIVDLIVIKSMLYLISNVKG